MARYAAYLTSALVALFPLASGAAEPPATPSVVYANQRPSSIPAPGTPVPAPAGLDESQRVRLVVLTDIGNEPDDSQSLVRLLTYSNEIDIEAIVATTSASLPDAVHPEMIAKALSAYAQALPNLRAHASGWPSAAQLSARVRAGSPRYGMAGVGKGLDTAGSRAIIAAVDGPDPRPVWVTAWGGAADLAQALWSVRQTRSARQVDRFVQRLRVHAISDQDDTGAWIRQQFPKLFWIGSIHAFRDYSVAGWSGIGADINAPDPAVDQTLINHDWQKRVAAMGPLGAVYPLSTGIMEGDTPSFLGLIPNGLNLPARPDYGGWGGRHGKVNAAYGLYADAADTVVGRDGSIRRDARATVWRWREAVQNDFLARVGWSVTPGFAEANHPPALVLNGQPGMAPLVLKVCEGQKVRLSGAGTQDPDKGQALSYKWWQYREPTFHLRSTRDIALTGADQQDAALVVPTPQPNAPRDYHVILEVRDNGVPALTRYRRVILSIKPAGSACAL